MEKLIGISEFILQQDKIFPAAMMANEFIELLAEKYSAIVKYNKFLNQPLTIEMFEGENKIFIGGKYNDIQPSTNWNYYSIADTVIFKDTNGKQNASIGLKISDLTGLGLKYIKH